MVIGAVALIVIGPKDLPKALRTVGQMTSKIRKLAGEFQNQFNEAMREAELDDVKREVEGINRSVTSMTAPFNPIQTVRDELKGAIEAKSPAISADPAAAPGPPTAAAAPDVLPEIELPPPLDPPDAASPMPRHLASSPDALLATPASSETTPASLGEKTGIARA